MYHKNKSSLESSIIFKYSETKMYVNAVLGDSDNDDMS